MIKPNDNIGLSVNTDPNHKAVIGREPVVFQVDYLPEGLDLLYHPTLDNPGHRIIIPSDNMSIEHYIELLNEMKTSPYQ